MHKTPAEPAIQNLTEEQANDLWLQFSHLHPKRVNVTTASFEDAEFEEFEKELAEESAGVLYDTTEIVPYGGEAAPVFLVAPPDVEPSGFSPDDWEDV